MNRRQFLVLSAAIAATPAFAADGKLKEHSVTVAFPAPSPGYSITLVEVRKVGDELWAKFQVKGPKGITPAVLGKASTAVKFEAPDLPVKVLVTGKKWDWDEKEAETKSAFVNLDKLDDAESKKMTAAWDEGKVVFTPKADK